MQKKSQSRYRWVIHGLLISAQLSIGINVLAPAPLFPFIMEEYGLDRGSVSVLVAVMALVLAVGNVPSGFMAARFGVYRTFALGSFLMSAGMLAPFMTSFAGHVLWRVALGLGVGIVIPLVGGVSSQWFGRRELPIINGTNWMGQTSGMAISMFLAVPIANLFGWKLAIFTFGAVAMIGSIAWVVLGKDGIAQEQVSNTKARPNLLAVLKEKTTGLIAMAFVGPFLAYLSLNAWLPTYYNEVFGMSLSKAGLIIGLAPLVGLIASPAAGLLSGKLGLRRPFLIGAGVLFIISGFGSFLVHNEPLIYISVIGLGISQWVFIPMIFIVATELPGKTPSEVAVVLSAGLAVGNLLSFMGPLLVGVTTDAFGSYLPSFSVLAVLPILMILSGFMLPETGPRNGTPAQFI